MKLSRKLFLFGRNLLVFFLVLTIGPFHWLLRMMRLVKYLWPKDEGNILLWPWEWLWCHDPEEID